MKVFLSSVISGFEVYRDAAAAAAKTLEHEVIRAEEFAASPTSPQRACLAEARAADAVLLILGARYGTRQASGLAPTHEEYREVRDDDKVLVFVQRGVTMEPEQKAFVDEVQGWEAGKYTDRFGTPEELSAAVTKALHRFELERVAGPVDAKDLLSRAHAELPQQSSGYGSMLTVVVTAGPTQALLRPAELADGTLGKKIAQQLLFGPSALFDLAGAADPVVSGGRLVIPHKAGGLSLDTVGTVVLQQPAVPADLPAMGLRPIIEEDLCANLAAALRLAGAVLDMVDASGRASTVLPVASVTSPTGWRTRAEHAASPNSMPLTMRTAPITATLNPAVRRRAALLADPDAMARDFIALMGDEVRRPGFGR